MDGPATTPVDITLTDERCYACGNPLGRDSPNLTPTFCEDCLARTRDLSEWDDLGEVD